MQVYLSQYGGVVVVWTINEQAAAKSGRDVNLTVVERGPIVTVTAPGLPDLLKVVVGAVDKRDYAAHRIRDRPQVTVIGIVSRGNIVAVTILDLSATIFTVDRHRFESELSAVARTQQHRTLIGGIELRVTAVLRLINVRLSNLPQLNTPA